MVTFLDTNVLINVLKEDPESPGPNMKSLNDAKSRGRILITDIVYSEFSIALATEDEVDEVIKSLGVTRISCPAKGLFRAGKAFKAYKEANAGPKGNVLPDFLIGAHAAAENAPLVTTDVKRMSQYFPDLTIIQP